MEHRLKTLGAYKQKRAGVLRWISEKDWGTQLAVWSAERTCLFSRLSIAPCVKMSKCAPAVLMVFFSQAARFQYSSSLFPFADNSSCTSSQHITCTSSQCEIFYRENAVNSVLRTILRYISRHMITGTASHSLKYIMRHYSSGAPEHNMSVNVCFVNASVLFK